MFQKRGREEEELLNPKRQQFNGSVSIPTSNYCYQPAPSEMMDCEMGAEIQSTNLTSISPSNQPQYQYSTIAHQRSDHSINSSYTSTAGSEPVTPSDQQQHLSFPHQIQQSQVYIDPNGTQHLIPVAPVQEGTQFAHYALGHGLIRPGDGFLYDAQGNRQLESPSFDYLTQRYGRPSLLQ